MSCYGNHFLLGDVTAQFIAAPPTCPGDSLIFNCTVGNKDGITVWRVGGRSECALVHSTQSDPQSCGSGSPFIVSTGTGFGTNATFFTSILKATAIPTLNGTLVECFGPVFSRGAGNLVGYSILQIFGELRMCILNWYVYKKQSHSYEAELPKFFVSIDDQFFNNQF